MSCEINLTFAEILLSAASDFIEMIETSVADRCFGTAMLHIDFVVFMTSEMCGITGKLDRGGLERFSEEEPGLADLPSNA